MAFKDRRDFLRLFGVTAAAVPFATKSASASPEIEKLTLPQPDLLSTEPLIPMPQPAWTYSAADALSRAKFFGHAVVYSPLYSALEIDVSRGHILKPRHVFFSYAQGQCTENLTGNRAATPVDTNLNCAASLCVPEAYLVERVGVLFSPATPEYLRNIVVERCVVRIILGSRQYFQAPVGIMYSIGAPTGSNNLLLPSTYGSAKLDIPVVLLDSHTFTAELATDGRPLMLRAGTRGKIWIVYEGRHARAIQ